MVASQTKILEDRTKDRACDFEVLFKHVSTRFGQRFFENGIENARPIFCSVFQNIRLGGIKIDRFTNQCTCSDAIRCIRSECCDFLYKEDRSVYKPLHQIRCCDFLYKEYRSVYKPVHMLRCNPVHRIRCIGL